jgi:hypothetical protein
MKTYLDCYPCVLRQTIEAARISGASEPVARDLVLKTLDLLRQLPEGLTPPQIGTQVHAMVREETGHADPYQVVKQQATKKALLFLPKLRSLVSEAEDPFATAVRLSIAGNIIDYGPNPSYDLWDVVQQALRVDLAINDLESLRERLNTANSILFLGDNAGETVFDRVLIETLKQPVVYAVRGGPIINDATLADAKAAGVDGVASLVSNGSRIPGTVLSDCSPAFQKRFKEAEVILAKGQGNYETLSEVQAPIWFLLKVKCPVIGRNLGAAAGSFVVKQGLRA